MSKSAMKALTKAQDIMITAGVDVNLSGYITDADLRKNWRNADQLAALIIDSAANAFGTENSTTFADNMFDDMAEAVERYISANLDDWTHDSFVSLKKTTAGELRRLAAQVALNVDFEAREAAHAVAMEVQHRRRVAEYFLGLDYAGRCAKLDADHEEALAMDANISGVINAESTPPAIVGLQQLWVNMNEAQRSFLMALAHEEALAIDKQLHQDEFFNATTMMRGVWVNLNHEEALEDDRRYQTAIATIADSVNNPSSLVWRGCSDTVKAQIIKHHHDEALRMNASMDVTGSIEPPMDIRVQRFPSAIEALQANWANLNACNRSALLAMAHDAALEVNRQLDELRNFTLADGEK